MVKKVRIIFEVLRNQSLNYGMK